MTYSIDQSKLAINELATLDAASMDKSWNLQKYFGHIKVISTNTETERFKRCQRELAKVGLGPQDYEIFPGVDATTLDKSIWSRVVKWGTENFSRADREKRLKGQAGCFMAHYRAVKDTVERYKAALERLKNVKSCPQLSKEDLQEAQDSVIKFSSVLIFEDNVGFGRVTGYLSADVTGYGLFFRLAMKDLKNDWDMFYFMAMGEAKRVSQNLAKLDLGMLTKCYAIHAPMYERVLAALEVINMPDKEIKPVDHPLRELHKTSNSYVSLPPLCYRFASMSEVGGELGKMPQPPSNWQSQIKLRL
jgi:hypothetical protein